MSQSGEHAGDLLQSLEAQLTDNTYRHHSREAVASFLAEARQAHAIVSGQINGNPEDSAGDSIDYMTEALINAQEWSDNAVKENPDLLLRLTRHQNTSDLTRELLRQTSGNHAYRARVLAEAYFTKVQKGSQEQLERSKEILVDKIRNDWASQNYHSRKEQAVAEQQVLRAFDKVSTGEDYPELSLEWHEAHPNADIREHRLIAT
ncbi:hypothetical protein E1189_02210 [Sansalvadorimonas verongulae]|nr:hypothetical protein [Sansalvadorimonas verongulae]